MIGGIDVVAILTAVAAVIGAVNVTLGIVNQFRKPSETPPDSMAGKILDRLSIAPPGMVRGWMNGTAAGNGKGDTP